MNLSKRKFYYTKIEVEVLTEYKPNFKSLEDVAFAMDEGIASGEWNITKTERLNGRQAAEALLKQASDPEFFQLTENGEDVE